MSLICVPFIPRAESIYFVQLSSQGGGKIEAEPIDVHVQHQVTQASQVAPSGYVFSGQTTNSLAVGNLSSGQHVVEIPNDDTQLS